MLCYVVRVSIRYQWQYYHYVVITFLYINSLRVRALKILHQPVAFTQVPIGIDLSRSKEGELQSRHGASEDQVDLRFFKVRRMQGIANTKAISDSQSRSLLVR